MSPSFSIHPVVLLVADEPSGMEVLQTAAETLGQFGVLFHQAELSPDGVEALKQRSLQVWAVIAASRDQRLPARCAKAFDVPTLRVPAAGRGRSGLELLRDDAGNLPAGSEGWPFATMAIGAAGAKNAALFVVAALAVNDAALREKWLAFRARQTADVLGDRHHRWRTERRPIRSATSVVADPAPSL